MTKIVFNLETEESCKKCEGVIPDWAFCSSWHFCKIRLENPDVFIGCTGTHQGCNQFKARPNQETADLDNEFS